MSDKKLKKTGIIRTGAVVPFIIVTTIVVVFNIFFLDGIIKRSIEYFGGKINGAEVNVGNVATSFKDLQVVVTKVEFTNAKKPTHNLFEIGEIRFQMLWDALLRAKVVIDESSLNDITIDGVRRSAGKVFPPEVSEEGSAIAKETLENAKKEFKGNIFGDVAALLGGTNSSELLKGMEGELKSKQRYEELEKEVKQKEEELKTMIDQLPKGKEIDQFDDRIKAVNWKGLKDLKKAPGILKEANDIQKDISSTVKKYDEAQKRVKSEIEFVQNSTKEIEKLVQEDIKALENKMSIPSLDTDSVARVLFGADFIDQVAGYNKYITMAKEYMPPPKENREKPVSTPARGNGRNYQFGKPKAYPMFWLKLAKISSKNDQGNVAGKIENVTTNQNVIDKATTAQIDANFPSVQINGIQAAAVIDHRSGIKDTIDLSVASFPVGEKVLSKSDSVSFKMTKAQGATKAQASLINNQVTLQMNNTFTSIDYQTEAKSKVVKELLDMVVNEAGRVTLNAKASGSADNLKFNLNSNLAQIISTALSKMIKAKVDEAKQKVRSTVEGELAKHKEKIDSTLASLKQKHMGEIEKAKGKINQLNSKVDEQKKSGQNAVEDKGKDLLKNLKKKFKF